GAAGSRTILPTAYPAPQPRTALGKSAGRGFLLALGGGEYCQHQRAGQGERRRVAGAGGEQAEDGRAGTVSGVVGEVPPCAGLGAAAGSAVRTSRSRSPRTRRRTAPCRRTSAPAMPATSSRSCRAPLRSVPG